MRTTLNLDDDVLLAVKERARREGRSVGEVVSGLTRQALVGTIGPVHAGSAGRHGFTPLPHRGAAVSNALIDALGEDETA